MSEQRRRFLTIATSTVAGAGITLASVPFIGSLKPASHLKNPFIDIGKLKPGTMTVSVIDGKPLFILKRTEQQILSLETPNLDLLDPKSLHSNQPEFAQNNYRSLTPEIFVAYGVCTHLGCSPSHRPDAGAVDLGGKNWTGGFLCPCHGAKYDLAGRVFKNMPAPRNLDIPNYEINEENKITILDKS